MIFPAILPLLGLVIFGRVYLEELKEIEKVMHESTFGSHLQLEGAIEHFFDSFPNEWGLLVHTEDEKTEYIESYCKGIVIMENGQKAKVEIFLANDVEDDDDPWVCKRTKFYHKSSTCFIGVQPRYV